MSSVAELRQAAQWHDIEAAGDGDSALIATCVDCDTYVRDNARRASLTTGSAEDLTECRACFCGSNFSGACMIALQPGEDLLVAFMTIGVRPAVYVYHLRHECCCRGPHRQDGSRSPEVVMVADVVVEHGRSTSTLVFFTGN